MEKKEETVSGADKASDSSKPQKFKWLEEGYAMSRSEEEEIGITLGGVTVDESTDEVIHDHITTAIGYGFGSRQNSQTVEDSEAVVEETSGDKTSAEEEKCATKDVDEELPDSPRVIEGEPEDFSEKPADIDCEKEVNVSSSDNAVITEENKEKNESDFENDKENLATCNDIEVSNIDESNDAKIVAEILSKSEIEDICDEVECKPNTAMDPVLSYNNKDKTSLHITENESPLLSDTVPEASVSMLAKKVEVAVPEQVIKLKNNVIKEIIQEKGVEQVVETIDSAIEQADIENAKEFVLGKARDAVLENNIDSIVGESNSFVEVAGAFFQNKPEKPMREKTNYSPKYKESKHEEPKEQLPEKSEEFGIKYLNGEEALETEGVDIRVKGLPVEKQFAFAEEVTFGSTKRTHAGVTFDAAVPEEQVDNAPFTKLVDMINLMENVQSDRTQMESSSLGDISAEAFKHCLKRGKSDQIKTMLRNAHWSTQHDIRQTLWTMTCKYQHKAVSHNIYADFESAFFPPGEDNDFVRVPSFVDINHAHSYLLNNKGIAQANKVLGVLEHSSPEVVYSPLLYPIVSLFLHYMEPSDCYNCVDSLLHEKKAGYISQTKVAYEASKLVIKDLAKKYAKSGYVLLVRNTSNIDSSFDSWIWWIFQDLPFTHLVRVMDCFLQEGVKIFYRISLAILILFAKSQSKKSVRRDTFKINVLYHLRQFCRDMPVSTEKLLKTAFSIRGMTRKEIRKLQTKHEMYINSQKHLAPAQDKKSQNKMSMSRSFSGPIVLQHTNTSTLTVDMLFAIWTWIPTRYAVCQPELLYTSDEHGTSLVTLYQRVENHQPTVIVIKTTTDEIFGAFCSAYWSERRQTKSRMLSYFGTGETFVFTLYPERKKYEWVGLTDEHIPNTANMFQAGDRSILTIGGGHGEAIYLDENLLHCRTERCDTFNNEPLCKHQDFMCKVVEVYGFQ